MSENQPSANNTKSSRIISNFYKLFPPKWKWAITILMIFGVALIIFGISYGIYLACRSTDQDEATENPGNATTTTTPPDENVELKMVSRAEWSAQPPKSQTPLDLPSKYIIIAHTAGIQCPSQEKCSQIVKWIQKDQMERLKLDDISYNFLVGGDGSCYVGRGWEFMGAHSKGYNAKSICITFIGRFAEIEPPNNQLNAAKKLIEEGVKLGKLAPDYKLYGHCQVTATKSPGAALYEIIQTWPHWSNDTKS